MNSRRLLILDDEIEVGKTIAMVAQKAGFSVQIFDKAEDFFKSMNEWLPTHILIDLAMPVLDGVEVQRHLAELHCTSAVILASGLGAKVLDAARLGGLERGLNIVGCLPKPFKAKQLHTLLATPVSAGTAKIQLPMRVPNFEDADFQSGLSADEFILHYQPKVSLRSGKVIGFEALVRWEHHQHGLLHPIEFIPSAEISGYVDDITARIFEIGLNWLQDIVGQCSVSLEFNVSALSLQNIGMVDKLTNECAKRQIDPKFVTLEITESSAVGNYQHAIDLLTRFRIKGFQLAIDDYGTGYSSMRQLERLPFSELKIDQSFVKPMRNSEDSRKIVASTIKLAHELGLLTVAEGIEDLQTMHLLRDAGCDLAQGYYIARPMPGAQASHWARQNLN